MKRVIYTLLFATVAGALTYGAAASLNVSSTGLGSGTATVNSCDDDVTVGFTLDEDDPSMVSQVEISDIGEECAEATLHYVIKSATDSEEGPVAGAVVVQVAALVTSSGDVLAVGSIDVDGPLVSDDLEDVSVADVGEVVITIVG